MLIAVAERRNDRGAPAARLRRAARAWARHPLACVLASHAMRQGPSRTRLHNLLGLRPDRVVNLLPPDRRPGTWDAWRAREVAALLGAWARAHAHELVLLGRRVAEAFGVGDLPFGAQAQVDGGVRVLVLPHPSGRSRYLNDPRTRPRVRRWVARFVREAA